MNAADRRKNFRLGKEVYIFGTCIDSGLRRFHELTKRDIDDELDTFNWAEAVIDARAQALLPLVEQIRSRP